jgi:hypothetical protein
VHQELLGQYYSGLNYALPPALLALHFGPPALLKECKTKKPRILNFQTGLASTSAPCATRASSQQARHPAAVSSG